MPVDWVQFAKVQPRPKDVAFYHEEIGKSLTPAGRELILKYAKVPEEQIEQHCFNMRDLGYAIVPFASISTFWFLEAGLSAHPRYSQLLSRLTTESKSDRGPPRFLDLGTTFGQDPRKLCFDGVPDTSLYGVDLFPEFEDLGFEMWRDRATYRGGFIVGDLFSESADDALFQTRGSWDVINLTMFLHFLDLPDQQLACRRLLELLKPGPGQWIIGIQVGCLEAGPQDFAHKVKRDATSIDANDVSFRVYRHNCETFRELWQGVSTQMNIPLDVSVEYGTDIGVGGKDFFPKDSNKRLYFLIQTI